MLFENDAGFLLAKTVLITLLTVGMMCSTTETNWSKKTLSCCFGGYFIWVFASSLLLIRMLGWISFARIFLLTITAPAILLFYLMAKDHAMQVIFNYMTQINLSLILVVTETLINVHIGGGKAGDLLLRILLHGGTILLEYRFVRRPFRRIADTLNKNWMILALIPIAFCALLLLCAMFPVHFIENPWAVARIYALAATMLAVYYSIFQSLLKNCAASETEKANLFLSTHAQGLQRQLDALRESSGHLRRFEEDVEQFLQTVIPELDGELAFQAAALAERTDHSREERTLLKGCREQTVREALFMAVRNLEKSQYIVSCGVDVPGTFHRIPSSELAVILVAALENAAACCEPKDGEIELYLYYVNNQLAAEVTSPCGAVSLDEGKIPAFPDNTSLERTKTISTFTAKYGERPYYQIKDGRMHLWMLIDDSAAPSDRTID